MYRLTSFILLTVIFLRVVVLPRCHTDSSHRCVYIPSNRVTSLLYNLRGEQTKVAYEFRIKAVTVSGNSGEDFGSAVVEGNMEIELAKEIGNGTARRLLINAYLSEKAHLLENYINSWRLGQ
jgi:hypothetical protein